MMVDIPNDQIAALERVARQLDVSLEAVVLESIAAFLKSHREQTISAAFGVRPDAEDGLVYQERLRAEWDR
jgi:hypothetical protein